MSRRKRKPGQFTGKWQVLSQSGVVLANGCEKDEAANLIVNHKRSGLCCTMRRERVQSPPDIIALDMGDDE